jgi:hypothetical protein
MLNALVRLLGWLLAPFAQVVRWARLRARGRVECDGCFYFDFQAGQDAIQGHAVFRHVAGLLTPDEAANAAAGLHDEEHKPLKTTPEITTEKLQGRAHAWNQYGLCTRFNEARNRYDACENWRKNTRSLPVVR